MSIDNNIILDIKDLVVDYETMEGIVHAVNGIDFTVKRKQSIGLVGETGAGKTTLARAVMRLVPNPPGVIRGGKIVLDGMDIFSMPESKMRTLRGNAVSMIFQDPMTSLNPVITVGEQIAEIIRLHEGLTKVQGIKRAKEMLELVGIPAYRDSEYPHQFSGGMKQRVVIAMALACNPKLLIADEPTTALDVTIQAQILEMIKELRDKLQMSMIMITHDLGIVAETCDEVSVIYAGRIVEQGTVRKVFKSAMHPYTEGLFNSLPIINSKDYKIKPIPGLMPDPIDLPKGCAFHPRCPYAFEQCKKDIPKLKVTRGSHQVACHAYNQDDFKLKGRI